MKDNSTKLEEYMKKPLVIERDSQGFFTLFFPDLPCCITIGTTLEAVLENATDAKREWFKACIEEGLL